MPAPPPISVSVTPVTVAVAIAIARSLAAKLLGVAEADEALAAKQLLLVERLVRFVCLFARLKVDDSKAFGFVVAGAWNRQRDHLAKLLHDFPQLVLGDGKREIAHNDVTMIASAHFVRLSLHMSVVVM